MTGRQMNHLRKTHPMVLIAAIALTIFSLIGSAAITGQRKRDRGTAVGFMDYTQT